MSYGEVRLVEPWMLVVVFLVASAALHWGLVFGWLLPRWSPRGVIFWKASDYAWVAVSGFSIAFLTIDTQRAVAAREYDIQVVFLDEAKKDFARSVGFTLESCPKVASPRQPDRLTPLESWCERLRALQVEMPKIEDELQEDWLDRVRPEDFRDSSGTFNVAADLNSALLVENARKLARTQGSISRLTAIMREKEWELALRIICVYALILAMALRITKVTGEIRLELAKR